MLPLKPYQKIRYNFGEKTSYSAHHLGQDVQANFVPLYAPLNGRVERHDGTEGGITLWFWPDNGVCKIVRFMHLSQVLKTGRVNEGDQIAVTGNSGSLTTGAHLHWDCSNNDSGTFWNNFSNFVDPSSLNWGESSNMGKVIWDGNVEVIFTEGQVNEMSGAFGLNHTYNGGESWGFVQECERAAQAKFTELANKPPVEKIVEKIVYVPQDITDKEKQEIIDDYLKTHTTTPPEVCSGEIDPKQDNWLVRLLKALKIIK